MPNRVQLPPLPTIAPEISNNKVLPQRESSKFSAILESYMNLVETTGQLELEVDNMQIDFATGKTDDVVSLLLAQQKALAAINFTVQVTNKALNAYQEIMRISM